MRATIYYTMGFGLDSLFIKANTYKELTEKIDSFINNNTNRIITVLGHKTSGTIEKIIYTYPSGKKFIKSFV